MRHISWDTDADALYARLREGVVSRTETIDDLTLVDYDNQGNALGVEILRPARDWPIDQLAEFGVNDADREFLSMINRAPNGGHYHYVAQRVAIPA